MNKVLYQLAFRNVQKYKKHYLLSFVIIFFLSIFFISASIIGDNRYQAEKEYNQKTYGHWYVMFGIDENYKSMLEEHVQAYLPDMEYGQYYEQGIYKDNKIGFIDEVGLDLCHLQIIQGHYPTQDNEIMVSTDLSQELKLHQKVELKVNNNVNEYTVVGIVKNSQKGIFPDIYTHIHHGYPFKTIFDRDLRVNNIIIIDPNDPDGIIPIDELICNEYGYSANQSVGLYQFSVHQTIILVEISVLVIFILMILTSTSLKRRTKEFALLRGVGMTTRQLFLMIIYENIIMIIVSIICGALLSLGISYGASLYLQEQFGCFVYQLNWIKILVYVLFLVAYITCSMIFPGISSAKKSLSGAFEGKRFQYIQIRYRKLHYQKKWRLALREMRVYKGITICLFIVFGLCFIYYIGSIMNPGMQEEKTNRFESFHYLEYEVFESGEKKSIKKLNLPHTIEFHYQYVGSLNIDENGQEFTSPIQWKGKTVGVGTILCIDDTKWIDQSRINGRKPENDNEILLGNNTAMFYTDQQYNEHIVGYLSIGDSIEIHNKTYYIVGQIIPNETMIAQDGIQYSSQFLPSEHTLYVSPKIYKMFPQIDDSYEYSTLRTYYTTDKERDECIEKVQSILPWVNIIDSDEGLLSNNVETLVEIEPYMLITPMAISLILCYFLNKNQITNNKQDYQLYKLIGMTNKELIFTQFCKACIMTLSMSLFGMIWIIAFYSYYHTTTIPIIEYLFSCIMILVVTSIIYCLPFYKILKTGVFIERME